MPISTIPVDASAHSLALLRLCQLVSPALPVGAFHFSQGLEYAVEAGWVRDEAAAAAWIGGIAKHAIATLDLPVLRRLHQAWCEGDAASVLRWSRRLLAARETAELRAEDRHLGSALARVLPELEIAEASAWIGNPDASFAALFALASARWDIAVGDAVCGYLWTWCENQVLAAVKLVPLGQSAGQRLLHRLVLQIPRLAQASAAIADEDIGVATPMQGLASACHEHQYSRLFRS
jgi:urease accessory protein